MVWIVPNMGLIIHIFVPLICFLTYAYCSGSDSCAPSLSLKDGVTNPQGDILLKVGEDLEIFCILNENYMRNATHGLSENLGFYRNHEQLPSEIVNKSTIRLHIKNMTASHANYYCKFIPDKVVCLNAVAVATEPQPVSNFRCISHNWNNLTCTWKEPQNYIKTTYRLTYILYLRSSRGMVYTCPNNESQLLEETGERYCFWNVTTVPHYRQAYKEYLFVMNATNIFGQNITTYPFHHFQNVAAAPPVHLTFLNKTRDSILLAWNVSSPMKIYPPGVMHRLFYQSEFDTKFEWKAVSFPLNDTRGKYQMIYNLTNLKYAHALYDIRVSLKGALADDSLWSKNASITVRTLSAVPEMPPKTDIGSFEISEIENQIILYIYWQQIPIEYQNGEKFNYSINAFQGSMPVAIEPKVLERTYAKYEILNHAENYTFEIYSANEINRSQSSSSVSVPGKNQRILGPKSFSKIAYGEKTYELSWKPPPPQAGVEIESYTIFWCKNERDRPYQCSGYLDWIHIDTDITAFNKTVEDNSIYQFAVSANTKTSSSGMIWASCTVIHDRYVSKMKNVWIKNIGSTFIEMAWNIECTDRTGLIEGYRIYYCPIVSPANSDCRSPLKNITIRGSLNTVGGNVTNLLPYTTYMLEVTVVTKAGEGMKSDKSFNTTYESAPSAPQNLRYSNLTNTSFTVTWDKPEKLNGVLRSYIVSYNNKEINSEANLKITLTGLKSFTNYTVRVKACTLHCTESESITVLTKEGAPGKMKPPIHYSRNETHINLQWSKPEELGGITDSYQLLVLKKVNGIESEEIYNTKENSSSISISECTNGGPRVALQFKIRAGNKDPDGNLMWGEWSKPVGNVCKIGSSSRPVLYIFLIIASAIIFFVFMAIAANRIWLCCNRMRKVEIKLPPGLQPITSIPPDINWPEKLDTPSAIPTKPFLTDEKHSNSRLYTVAADQQSLLENKQGQTNDLEVQMLSGESSGCSSGNESVSSSVGSVPNVSDSGTEHITDRTSTESSSLRLRNVKGGDASSGQLPRTNKGYVTMPTQDITVPKTAWLKPASPSSGYCQVGVDSTPPTTSQPQCSPGYVPVPLVPPPTTVSISSNPSTTSYVLAGAINRSLSPVNKMPNFQILDKMQNSLSSVEPPLDTNDLITIDPTKDIDTENKECLFNSPNENGGNVSHAYVKVGEDVNKKAAAPSSYIPLSVAAIKSAPSFKTAPSCKTGDIQLASASAREPDVYSRLGAWNASDGNDVESQLQFCKLPWDLPNVPSVNLQMTTMPTKQTDDLKKAEKPKNSGYVSHRQFESKLLKED